MTPTDDQRRRTEILAGLLSLAAPGSPSASDARGALLRAIFAVGFGRVGDTSSELLSTLGTGLSELPPHVQVLVHLYLTRRALFMDGAPAAALDRFRVEARAPLTPAERGAVDHLVLHSLWLHPSGLVADGPLAEKPRLRPALERKLLAAEENLRELPTTIAAVAELPGLYDYEIGEAVRRVLALAIAAGDRVLVQETATRAHAAVARIRIWTHMLRAIAACADAAAYVGDAEGAKDCAAGFLRVVEVDATLRTRDISGVARKVLAAVVRADGSEAARRFVDALSAVVQTEKRPSAELSSVVAAAFYEIGDIAAAEQANTRALDQALTASNMEPEDRYSTGAAVLAAVKGWTLERRALWCSRVMESLTGFTDIPAYRARFAYPTHELLLAELAVETIVHDAGAEAIG